jgi:putative flippase GtrA
VKIKTQHFPGSLLRSTRIRYVIASAFSFGLTLLLSFLSKTVVGLNEYTSVAITLLIVFVTNFFVIRILVFKSTSDPKAQLITFAASSLAFRGLDYLLFLFLFSLLGLPYMLALGAGLTFTFILKYIFQKHVIFR